MSSLSTTMSSETSTQTFAAELKSLLAKHDECHQQILLIEKYIQNVHRMALWYVSQGRKGQALHLLNRKTAAIGVKYAYRIYRIQKWIQVQAKVKEIISMLQPENLPSFPALPVPNDLQGKEVVQLTNYTYTMTTLYSQRNRLD